MTNTQERIDEIYARIETKKESLCESFAFCDVEDEIESIIASAIKFGELCAERDASIRKTHENFQAWLKAKDFYTTLVFRIGDRIFDRDGDVYRTPAVQVAFEAYQE